MFKKIKNALFGDMSEETNRRLIDQSFVSLNAAYVKAREGNINLEEHKELVATVEAMLQGERSWRNANYIQQLLVPLYEDERLEVELKRSIIDSQNVVGTDAHTYYNEASQSTEKAERQALLDRLIQDLQWKKTVRELFRKYSRQTRIRVGLLFFLSVVLFFLPGLLPFLVEGSQAPNLMVAMRAGLLGATFSMLISLNDVIRNSSLDELRVQSRYAFLLTRAVTGIGAALIFFFFLQADLLTGSMFPNVIEAGKALDFKNMALLIVWCFLAGFSEKLVPNLLSKTEEQAQVKQGG